MPFLLKSWYAFLPDFQVFCRWDTAKLSLPVPDGTFKAIWYSRESMEVNGLAFKFSLVFCFIFSGILLNLSETQIFYLEEGDWLSTFIVIVRIGNNVCKTSVRCQCIFKSMPCKTHRSQADVSLPVQKVIVGVSPYLSGVL